MVVCDLTMSFQSRSIESVQSVVRERRRMRSRSRWDFNFQMLGALRADPLGENDDEAREAFLMMFK